MCFCQVATPPLPPLAVPPQCPTAMIPWRGATIQVFFHGRRVHVGSTCIWCVYKVANWALVSLAMLKFSQEIVLHLGAVDLKDVERQQ